MDRRRAGALLALAACVACSAAAPTTSNHTALDLYDGAPEGCYYNFQHYGEGDRIMTNEPCLNCTCHNRMLMCYLRVCPFTKPIGQDCTIEKRADQCCPIVTCPDVPVDLLTSTSTTSPAEYGATGLGKHDKYGCSINGKYLSEGSKVPPTPNKPCEHCYCIRNMTTCVMQECTLHVDGCTPIYHKDVCCPVRYSCDHPEDEMPLLDDMSTTVRPTPGFLLTTTTMSPVTQMTQDCVHDDRVFADGAQIKTEKACEHCYCMKGDIVCVVQECGTPMENEGKNCTSLPPREGQCCPDTYICEGDELGTEPPADITTESVLDSPTTLLPPRRAGDEGSGYRNEPDEVSYTDIPSIQPENEGSGEEQVTVAPYDTTEKLSSEKPVDTDEITAATEEGQYTSHTPKYPSFEESEATTTNKIPGEFGPTNVPVKTDDEVKTTEESLIPEGVTDTEYMAPHEPTSTSLASEIYDKITTEPGEAFNTVPDTIPGEKDIESHKHIPSPTVASAQEIEKTTPSITEEEIATSGLSEEKTIKPEYSFPSPTTTAEETSDTIKVHEEKEAATEKYVPSTPSTSMIGEIETEAPEVDVGVTPIDIGKERDEPNASAATISTPTEKGDVATSEPDHNQNTVAVVDEDNIQPHVHTTTTQITSEEEAGTTLHSIELGSGIEDFTEENLLEPYDHAATVSSSVDEIIKTTSEPDKELNTIPSEIIGESSSEASVPEKATTSQETRVTDSDGMRRTDSKPTIASESSTLPSESTASRADHFTVTTEPSFRKEDQSSISTEKSKESETTTGKIDFTEEGFIPTSSHDEKLSTGANIPSIEQEFTTSLPDNEVEIKAPTTESIVESSISSTTIPEKLPEHPSEQGTEFIFGTATTEKISELTTLAAEIETHEEPGRIPGEGDCLLNGVTFRNNSVVPNSNNCHSGCKCVSSIIKCDPIICSPPPDYMDNCQSIYDSPDSCCPTYVCDHPRETVPPQSDNHMYGTESPQPTPTIECRGDQCELSIDTKHPLESSDKLESHGCGPEGCEGIAQKPDDSKYPLEYPEVCKGGKCEVPPTHEIVCDPKHGCQAVPVKPCEGEHCKATTEEAAKPPCEGDSCTFEVSSPQDTQQVPCKEEDGCKFEQVTPLECTGDSCKKNEIPEVGHNLPSQCKGSLCGQQTDTVPKEGTQHVSTESSLQEQTPFEVITEKLETSEGEHKTTESQKEPEIVSTQQPHMPDVQQEISTVIPETFTVSHEIVSESGSPEGSNEIDTHTTEERRTTLSESYATESDKSPHTTEKTIIPEKDIYESPESQTTMPIETTATADKKYSDNQDTFIKTTQPTVLLEKDGETPGFVQQTTISEDIDHGYTTVAYDIETAKITSPDISQNEVTKSHEPGLEIATQAQEFGAQTTLSPAIHELSTGMSHSEIIPDSDVKTETASTAPESVQVISKSTEPTTEEEYGFTDTPEYELPGTKTQEIEPIRIEPQDGTTESHKSPTGVEESTTKESEISEYITEKEQIEAELPIEVLPVTEFSQASDEKYTESSEQYGGKPEQPITRPPVDIISSEPTDIDAGPVIKDQTEIPPPFTNEPQKSFTEIEDTFVTGQVQTTTENSIHDATMSFDSLNKSTELIEPSTTEKMHEIVEVSLPSSEKPLYPDSLSVGVTEPQEISTKATEQDVSDKQQDTSGINVGDKQEPSSEVPPEQESSDIEFPKSEKPETEEDQSTETSVTEKTSEHLSTSSQELITKQPQQEEEIPEIPKSPITESHETFTVSPIIITTASKESPEPEVVTGSGEKTTYIPESEDNQVHLSTKAPEIFATEQETGTELPHKDHSKVPDLHITESYETDTQDQETEFLKTTTEISRTPDIKEVSTDEPILELHESDIQKQSTDSSITIEEMRTELPISQITTKRPESFVTQQQENIGIATSAPDTTKDEPIQPGFTQISETTQSEGEVQTEKPIHHIPEVVVATTKTPEDTKQSDMAVTAHEEHVTRTPVDEEEPEPGRTGSVDTITKAPEESQPVVTEQDEVSKLPEDVKESEIKTTEYEKEITKTPEDTKETQSDVTIQQDKVTLAPEVLETEVTRRKEDTTKAPEDIKESEPHVTILEETEVTKVPEDLKESETDVSGQPEKEIEIPADVTSQEEIITKAPEVTRESELDVTSQIKEVTEASMDKQETEAEVTKIGEEVTKAPDDTKVSLPEITKQEEEVTKVPEYTKESIPEITGHEEDVTKSPEDTKESLPEITKQEEFVTIAPEDMKESPTESTQREEGVTKAPEDTKESLPEITDKEEDETESPEHVKGEEEVTKAPEDTKELLPEITGLEEGITKAPEETKESIPEVTGHEEDVTKAPEDTKESLPDITKQEEFVTKAPEDTKQSLPEITGQEEGITKAPEGMKESQPEITKQEEEVTKAPGDTKVSLPEITEQEEEITRAPEDTKESLPDFTGQEEEITKAPEETKESLPEITGPEKEVTKVPEETKESIPEVSGHEVYVTKAPEDSKETLPDISKEEELVTKAPEDTKESVSVTTSQEEEVTKAPEDTKESVPEITVQGEAVTKAPEDKKESVPEIASQGEEVTRVPEDTKESVPEITSQGEEITKAPEDTKEAVPEITSQEEEVTKAPEDTKESVPEITSQEEEVTKAPDDTKESVPEITSQGEEVTKAPQDTKESLPEVTKHEEEVTKAPEDIKESVSEITSQEEKVTKAPEDTKKFVPEITSQEEEVTKAPEDTKESVSEITSQGEEVTKAPEDMKESVPEITSQGEEVTQAAEDTKESVPEVTSQGEEVTKAPEDTKESVPEVTSQGEEVTKAPEDTKESVSEITSQGEEVTKAPEDTKESVPEITSQGEEVTKAPEDTKEYVPEVTSQGEEATKAPEDTKESVPEVTSQGEEVTQAPENTKESVPEVTSQGEEVTKAPEDTKESVPEVTSQEEEITKAPEDTKESVPEVTSQGEEVTQAPEDTKESVPEITSQGETVTKAPEDTKESVPEITSQGEEVTKAPQDTKESLPEVTRQGEEVTKAPEDTVDQESQPEVTSDEEKVTKAPEVIKESEPEVPQLSPEDIVTEKQETTPTLLEIHAPHDVISENDNKMPEDTTHKQIEQMATEQPIEQFSETTPDVIILEEHPHEITEESSTPSSHEERTTVYLDTDAPASEGTSQKPTEERIETVTKEVKITTKADEGVYTDASSTLLPTSLPGFDQITEKVPVATLQPEEIPSDHKVDGIIKENEPTLAPSSEETVPTVHIDSEKSPIPDTELPVQTEKIPSPTQKPVHHEIVHETTVAEDELIKTTPKATTIKQEEETAMMDDKLTKPEEKPVETSEVTPSAPTPESPKPAPGETQPTDELPTPEEDSHFPPTGMSGYGEPDYVEEDQAFGPGTCRYGGKVYVSAQQIPRDDPCDFCFCFRSDIICLQQSCPPPIHGCHEEPIQGFCCPRYECPVSMATTINMTTTTTTTTTTLPPHFPTHSYKGAAQRRGCQIKGHTYKVGEVVRSSSGPCLHCTCGGDGQMKCDPKACTPEPMLRQMIAAAVSAKRRR